MLEYLTLIKFTDTPSEDTLRERRLRLIDSLGSVVGPAQLSVSVPADRASEEAWDLRIRVGRLESATSERVVRINDSLQRELSSTPCVRKGWFFRALSEGES